MKSICLPVIMMIVALLTGCYTESAVDTHAGTGFGEDAVKLKPVVLLRDFDTAIALTGPAAVCRKIDLEDTPGLEPYHGRVCVHSGIFQLMIRRLFYEIS